MKYKKGQELLLIKPYFNFEVSHKLVVKEVYPHSSQYFCTLDGGYDVYLLEDYVAMKTPYQARLDKVLSKFEDSQRIGYIGCLSNLRYKPVKEYVINKKSSKGIIVSIYYTFNKSFDLSINGLSGLEISLDTVESLLKDLEAQNE